MKNYYLLLLITATTYFFAAKYLLDRLHGTIDIVIDELFHIPQGLAYCKRDVTYWDPKITTLPGLYIVTMTFLGSYFECNVYNLRLLNVIASVINYFLFASIINFVYSTNMYKTVILALNMVLLPSLFFFSLVYYTDTLSLTFLLMFIRLCFTGTFKISILIFGCLSVFMRQTNIVWIAMVFGHKLLDVFLRSSRVFGNYNISRINLHKDSAIARDIDKTKLKRYYNLTDFIYALKYHVSTCFVTFFKHITLHDYLILIIHSLLLASFVTFVFINGSIVVGDKQSHQAVIHIPQLFYFLLFYGIFGAPFVLLRLKTTISLMFHNKLKLVLLGVIFTVIVHYNTIVHPYLLADNRHFTFYVWNRWFGIYDFARYATIPAYLFLLVSLYDNLREQNCISFLLPYSICTFIVLCLQSMIEIRYFLIPFIILRLRFAKPSFKIVLLEFLHYVILNAGMFYVFFSKSFMWQNFSEPQRIIW